MLFGSNSLASASELSMPELLDNDGPPPPAVQHSSVALSALDECKFNICTIQRRRALRCIWRCGVLKRHKASGCSSGDLAEGPDLVSFERATRSNLHDKALVLAFQFLRGQMSDGKHLATFPLLDGLAEKFAAHTRDRGIRGGRDILRANNLKQGGGKILRDMKNVEFEQSSEEQGEREIKDGGFKQLPEEQEEWEMKDGGFQQLPEEQEEWEMKDGGFQQLPEEQGEREMKDGGFEQLLRNMRTKKRREMKDGGFEQLPEEQGEREMKDGRFEQLPEEQGEREMKDGGFSYNFV
uniref:Uncharacterized protein n=1 Tax=Globodera pallida TaxID=36090 RepID=A0A183CDM2_GLOPA